MCASDSLAPPQSRHAGESASVHLNRTALHENTPARDLSTRLLRAEVFIDWSTLPSVLRTWSGRSSQAVERGTCAGEEDPSRRRGNLPMSARPRVAATWTCWFRSCGPHSTWELEPYSVKKTTSGSRSRGRDGSSSTAAAARVPAASLSGSPRCDLTLMYLVTPPASARAFIRRTVWTKRCHS